MRIVVVVVFRCLPALFMYPYDWLACDKAFRWRRGSLISQPRDYGISTVLDLLLHSYGR